MEVHAAMQGLDTVPTVTRSPMAGVADENSSSTRSTRTRLIAMRGGLMREEHRHVHLTMLHPFSKVSMLSLQNLLSKTSKQIYLRNSPFPPAFGCWVPVSLFGHIDWWVQGSVHLTASILIFSYRVYPNCGLV
jgi:hypothetical protein